MAALAVHNFTLRSGGHRGVAGVDSRHRATASRHGRQLLGGHGALDALRPVADVDCVALFLVWQGVPQNLNDYTVVNGVDNFSKTIAQGPVASQRSQLSSWAPTAEASSTPTPRIPSRTPTPSRTSSSACHPRYRRRADVHVRAMRGQHNGRAGRSSPRCPSSS